MDEAQKYELEETLKELESYRGRHTEFITVLIPAGFNVFNVAKQIEDEKGTATNIKSNSTRKNVIDALEKVSRQLKTFGQTLPENGLAIYAGNVSQVEGKDDLRIWTIVPPKPLKIRMYRCDQTFILDPLKEMILTDDVYGLIIIERKEASIGILEGKSVRLVETLTSGVPSKVRAGGQCLSPESLIMKSDGNIIPIKDSHNPLIVISENFNRECIEETPIIAKWENKKSLFKVSTLNPRIEIKASSEHTFFVRTKNGIEEKVLADIREGDYLIMPQKIDLNLDDQKIEFTLGSKRDSKTVNLPTTVTPNLSRLLGYYLANGKYDSNGITIVERERVVAEYYQNLIGEIFKVRSELNFNESNDSWQLNIRDVAISSFFRTILKEKNESLDGGIPSTILMSSDRAIAAFISGFFDGRGYIKNGTIFVDFNSEHIAKQFQFAMLRIGVISSIHNNSGRFNVSVNDIESLKIFRDVSNLIRGDARQMLDIIISSEISLDDARRLVINGSDVARIIKNSGLSLDGFDCSSFFHNQEHITRDVFRSKILDKINDAELKKRLSLFYNSNLIAVKIDKIEMVGVMPAVDIETKNHNFLANGIIVHNSAQRYHRITEGLAKEFFRRVSEVVKDTFFEMKNLKGILVGGPIPTKEEFLETGQLTTQLREKVIAVKDIGDTGIAGLRALVRACEDVLEEQEVTKQRKILDEFFSTLGKMPEKVAYGEIEVEQRLNEGAVGKLILSKSLNREKINHFEKLAQQTAVEVHLVSNETHEGVQFDNLGGVGGLLRYAIHS